MSKVWKEKIPNILTMLNMTLGIVVIFLLLYPCHLEHKLLAVFLIIAGGIIDAIDGTIARRWNAVTNMGKQLDSFADLITFGLAPIALVHAIGLTEQSIVVSVFCWIYPLAGAFRLARYNSGDFTDLFIGLPITAAGLILTSYCGIILIWDELPLLVDLAPLTAGLLGILSLLMVSTFKINRLSF